jgi:hypothetical protein
MILRGTIAIALVTACGGGQTPHFDAGVDPHQPVAEVPVTVNRDIDLLFVIDDSPSMLDKQNNLANNFPNFVNVLNTVEGGLPNIHLGVVTTDMGTKASGSPTPGLPIGQLGQGGCAQTGKSGNLTVNGAAVTGTFISDIKQADGSRVKNYTGDLSSTFGMMARAGAGGCGFEQPLAAMKAALNNNPANAGFLRPAALLAVIFLTDEDDCSVTDTTLFGPDSPTLGPLQSFRCTRFGVTCASGGGTADAMNQEGAKDGCAASTTSTLLDDVRPYHDFLIGLKADPSQVAVSSIMGTTAPFQVELRAPPGGGASVPALVHSCTFNGAAGPEVADPPARMQDFLGLFPDRATASSICQQDLSGGLSLIADLIARSIGSPCVGASLADVDPATAGTQVDCIVEDVVGAAKTTIAECDASETPTCWKLEADPINCTRFEHLKLTVVRAGVPDPATITRMRCIVQ